MKNISRFVLSLTVAISCFSPLYAYAQASDATNCALSGGTWNVSSQRCEKPAGTLPGSITGVQFAPSGGVNINALTPYSNGIINFINVILVPVLFALAFITFLWGVFKYFIYHGEEEKSREEGKLFVFWGIIGFVIILSVWGLVNIVSSTFNLTPGATAPKYPTL